MDDKLDEAEFWLPSEFLTDEDILMDSSNKESFGLFKSNSVSLCFPNDFPYDCGSSVLSSPVESLVGSTETESSDEEDSLITGLTRQLTLLDAPKLYPTHHSHEKARVLSGSPQSTLTQVGSWSGRSTMSSNGSPNGPSQVSSPPTTPLRVENDPWDLIYQAAGQVARLRKMTGADVPNRNQGILGQPQRLPTPPPVTNTYPAPFFQNQIMKQNARGMWSRDEKNGWSCDSQEMFQNMGGRVGVGLGNGMGQSLRVWTSQQRNQQYGDLGMNGGSYLGGGYGYGFGYGSGGGVGGGGGVLKKERAGTGVFLPRRYENNSSCSFKASEYRKKPGCSPALLPNKVAQNKCLDDAHVNVQPKSRYNGGALIRDYEALMARRNALLAQQRRSLCPDGSISQEICLPQDWTY